MWFIIVYIIILVSSLDAKALPKPICDNPEDPRYQLFCGGSNNEVTARTPSWKNFGYDW